MVVVCKLQSKRFSFPLYHSEMLGCLPGVRYLILLLFAIWGVFCFLFVLAAARRPASSLKKMPVVASTCLQLCKWIMPTELSRVDYEAAGRGMYTRKGG